MTQRLLTIPLVLLAFASGLARAQGGVWTVVPVPGTSVAGVADADSGRVLIAGSFGAYTFDGFRRQTLPIFSTTSDSLVGKAVLRAKNGDVWFAHLLGVIRLAADGTVTRYDATSGLGNFASSEATCLAETPDGVIWVGTKQGGLSKFDGATWTTLTTDQGLPTQTVAGVSVDPNDGTVWVANQGATGGVAHVVGGTITRFAPTLPGTPSVRAVQATPSGRVWFGTDVGIGVIENGAITEYSAGTVVTAITEGAHGEIWIGSLTRGLGRFDNGAITFFPSGPPSNSILSLYRDAAGALWVGTSAGLSRYEGAQWLTANGMALGMPLFNLSGFAAARDLSASARGDSIDAQGVAWIGIAGSLVPGSLDNAVLIRRANGAYRWFGSQQGLPDGSARAIAVADSGQVWVGTQSGPASGLARMSSGGRVLQVLTAELPSPDVMSLKRAGVGSVWVGTNHGAALVEGTVVRALPIGGATMPDAAIRGVDLDAQGRTWFATGAPLPAPGETRTGAGAVRFDPADSSYVRWTTAEGLPTNNLVGVTVASNGDVWFASPLGAVRLRNGAIQVFNAANGLPANNVTRIAEGPRGEIWAAVTGGLAVYDGSDWSVFTVGDGLAGGTVTSVFADSLGIVATTGVDGASFHHPDRTPPRAEIQTAPPAATGNPVAQFAIRGGDLDSGTRGILLSFQMDERQRTPFAEDLVARFPDLLDGTHTFRLWAKDRALVETPVPETYTFVVDATPPRPIVAKPAFNQVIKGTVDVIGSVADARFANYTIEMRPEGVELWDTLLVSTIPPVTDTLYRWDTTANFDGVWELRVGIRDSLGLIGYVQVTTIVDNLAPNASVTAPAKVDHVQGGKVFTTDGSVELDIPPNAFAADQIVFIDPIAQPALPGGMPPGAIWGPSFLVHAGDMTLDKPATITFRLSGIPNVPSAIYRVLADTSVVPLGGQRTPDGASISTTLSQLGGVVVLFGANVAQGEGFGGVRGLDVQPRVLSPNGGGFDTRAAISFEAGKSGNGAVKVFDRAGRLVREVSENDAFAPGRNVVFWDGRDADGQVVPSGIYVVAVRFDGQTQVASIAVANR